MQKEDEEELLSALLKDETNTVNSGASTHVPSRSDLESQVPLIKGKRNEQEADVNSPKELFYTAVLFALWYIFNAWFNIDNKRALLMLTNAPITVAFFQMLTGWLFFVPLWLSGARKLPRLLSWGVFWSKIFPQGVCHYVVHVGAILAINAGATSFTHVVKALEPVFTAVQSYAMLGQTYSTLTYGALVPIVCGVGLASAQDFTFTWYAFFWANVSNVGSSLRSIYAKRVMKNKAEAGENLTPSNLFALLLMVSTVLALFTALILEGTTLPALWDEATRTHTPLDIMHTTLMSGVAYYVYNEISYIALSRVNQVTHAVVNTVKRAVVVVVTIWFFDIPTTAGGAFGSTVAILGTCVYSLARYRYG
eukprot:GDKI01011856.1.p1 GENE.GDKI01011856.1~~GDKI01011856.1.p1  ORF type:complete len:365 (-),score=91.22 GDKI01011856.1:600-1694(-)